MTGVTLREQSFRLPDLGEGLTDAEIVEWKVAVGDTVTVDQIVVEVETAKAAVEVPIPYAGTVLRLHAEAGAALAVGEVLITVGADASDGGGGFGGGPLPAATGAADPGGTGGMADTAEPSEPLAGSSGSGPDAAGGTPAAPGTSPAGLAAERYREEEQGGSGNVLIGYGTGHGPQTPRRRRPRGAAAAAGAGTAGAATATATATGPDAAHAARPAAGGAETHAVGRTHHTSGAAAGPQAGPAARDASGTSHTPASGAGLPRPAELTRQAGAGPRAQDRAGAHAPRVISPLVRRMAREHGIDLAGLVPSGPAGVVLRRDVEQAAERATGPAPLPDARGRQTAPTAVRQERPAPDGPERIPLRGVRRAVAEKLSRSRTEIPDATTWVDVDATGLLRAKKDLEAAEPGRRIGLLALLARICVAGLQRFPELNSTVDTEHREILRFSEVHLGFAAQTERGLVVPVVRDAHRLTTAQLAAELGRLTECARTGGLPPQTLTGGTFTLNNYGVFGVDGSTPIINHPEAALLGAGRIVDKPWVVDGALAVRKVMQLSLSFDHRVCDGGVAGGFLRFVADCVERPTILLADA